MKKPLRTEGYYMQDKHTYIKYCNLCLFLLKEANTCVAKTSFFGLISLKEVNQDFLAL